MKFFWELGLGYPRVTNPSFTQVSHYGSEPDCLMDMHRTAYTVSRYQQGWLHLIGLLRYSNTSKLRVSSFLPGFQTQSPGRARIRSIFAPDTHFDS